MNSNVDQRSALFDVHLITVINEIFEKHHYSVDRNKYQIHIPLPPKIDPTVTMMQVEDKPDVTYSDVGGCKEQIEKLREVVETPLLHVSILTLKQTTDRRISKSNGFQFYLFFDNLAREIRKFGH